MAETDSSRTHEALTEELTKGFTEAARVLFSAGGVNDTLQQVVELAVETIDGCDFAGIFLLHGDAVTTVVHTDAIVIDLDALQNRYQQGPCLDAVTDGGTRYASDLADDTRWPLYGPEATAAGLRSVLALSLSTRGARGAVNLYARYPQAFGVIDRAKGLLLAGLAGQAISTAQAHDEKTQRLDNLQGALLTRAVIGQAQGILIERERITADQAFDVLRRASQHLNIKLRDVAQTLVDTGVTPATSSASTPDTLTRRAPLP